MIKSLQQNTRVQSLLLITSLATIKSRSSLVPTVNMVPEKIKEILPDFIDQNT
jgi:hypothetical protein